MEPALRQMGVQTVLIETIDAPDNALREVQELGAPPLGALRIVELNDIVSAMGSVKTDGSGYISADLAAAIPIIGRSAGHGRGDPAGSGSGEGGGPLVVQHRLFYHGSLAKGTFMRSAVLPERTIVVRTPSMRKVEGRRGCRAHEMGVWAFEVVKTSGKSRVTRTSKQVIPVLEAVGGTPMKDAMLQSARKHEANVLECTRELSTPLLKKLAEQDLNDSEACERDGRLEPVVLTTQLLTAGFKPREEKYLHEKVCQIVESQMKKLRTGSFPIKESAYAYGVADPTGTLCPHTVCLVQDGPSYIDRDAIMWRNPALHPGDIRRVRIVTVRSLQRERSATLAKRPGHRRTCVGVSYTSPPAPSHPNPSLPHLL